MSDIEKLARAIAERRADEFWASAGAAKIVAENGATARQYWRWENLPESNREEYRRIARDAKAVLFSPIGEDQSDLVKRVVAVMQDFRYRRLQNAVVDGVTAELRADLTREAEASAILEAAHISRTSGSAGREMPTHKVRICQSDEEVCPFLLGQPCACPTKEAP